MILSLLLAATLAAPPVERARALMGTLCTASADGPGGAAALEEAFGEIARLERVFSSWRDDSELSRWNAAAGRAVPCSPDLYAVLDSSRALAELTGGAFDPTVEPLVAAWDLRGRGRVPARAEKALALARVGWRGLQLDPVSGAARLAEPAMAVDLGGIGKGFALDRAAARLREAGIGRARLNFGGEILAIGPCTVSVASPAARGIPVITLTARDAAVSTSAQSERGFSADGRRYGHILDPRSGAPVATRASVTVIASSATRADALSTALLVMGRDQAAAWSGRHPEVGVLWLEPGPGRRVAAWAWNVEAAAAPGAQVEWIEPPSARRASMETSPRNPDKESR